MNVIIVLTAACSGYANWAVFHDTELWYLSQPLFRGYAGDCEDWCVVQGYRIIHR